MLVARNEKHCNTLQHTAHLAPIYCHTQAATHMTSNALAQSLESLRIVPARIKLEQLYKVLMLQRTATHCNALQRTATHYNTL